MASMTINLQSAAGSSIGSSDSVLGHRTYQVLVHLRITANTYTSKRYVHFKIIDPISGSWYGGYKSFASKKTGDASGYVTATVILPATATKGTPFTHTYTVYTQVTTTAAQPGSTGWINKGTGSVTLPGLSHHVFNYYFNNNIVATESAYELETYRYRTAASVVAQGIRRFKNWKDVTTGATTTTSYHSEGTVIPLWGSNAAQRVFYHSITPETYPIVMKHKVDGAWLDGAPKIKINGAWLNPIDMFVKVDGEWIQA